MKLLLLALAKPFLASSLFLAPMGYKSAEIVAPEAKAGAIIGGAIGGAIVEEIEIVPLQQGFPKEPPAAELPAPEEAPVPPAPAKQKD